MKTNTLKAKLLNCFFAFTLVFGLCIPSIGTYAYAEPTDEITNDTVALTLRAVILKVKTNQMM